MLMVQPGGISKVPYSPWCSGVQILYSLESAGYRVQSSCLEQGQLVSLPIAYITGSADSSIAYVFSLGTLHDSL